MLPPPGFEMSNVSESSSRKRKLIADQGRTVSESCRFSRQSNLQSKVDIGINGQGSYSSHSIDSVTLRNRFEMDPQCHRLLNADNTGAPVPFSENSSDMMGIGHWNRVFYNNQPPEVWSSPSETLGPLELLRQSNVSLMAMEPAGHLYGKASFLEANCSDAGRSNDVSAVGVTFPGTSATAGKNENNRPVQDEVCCGGDSSAVVILDNFREGAQFHGVGHVPIRKEAERAVVKKSGNSLILRKNDPASVNVVVEGGERNDKRESLVDKSITHVGMPAPVVAEKLWDGSLQLNSTVTVSVIAFFKSGEKMPDLMWSEFLEVKGKVRLDAFEKYIQDLSRSRNRGLTVISLCCKEGSTKSELASMKEVAREYKKGKRIGLAQLSKGIDLYVCPRSDTIITILAKHGFFRGMAAVEDNQHSWMGCVVWRRNKASSNFVIQESEGKDSSLTEQTLKSLSDSSAGIGKNNIGPKNTEISQVQPELHTSSTMSLLPTSSVLSNSSSKTKRLQTSTDESACALPAMGRLLQVETPFMKNLEEKPKPTLEVHKHSATLASDLTKETRPTPFDDDLPEFDFGTARGVSRTPTRKLLDAVVVENQPPAEEFLKIHGSLPRKMPTIKSIIASNHGEFEDFKLPMFSVGTLSRMPLHKEVGGDGKTQLLPKLEDSQVVQRKIPFSTAAVPFSKKLFDDDDDMPEWRPPDMELHKQQVSETTRPLTTSISSEVLNSSFERLSPGRPGHLLSSQSPASYPPFASEAFTSAFPQSMNRSERPAQPRPSNEHIMRRPNPMIGFHSIRLLRPSLTPLDLKLQVRSTGLRGWKP